MTQSSETGENQSTADSLATVASGGTLVAASKVVSLAFGFLTQLVMARLLTEAAYGEVVLTLAVVNIGGLFATLGLDDGVMRELPHHEDTPAKSRGVIRAGFLTSIVSGSVVALLIYLSAPVLATQIFRDPSLTPLFRIASIGVPFVVLSNVAVSLARGARDARPHAIVNQLFQPFARLLLIAGLVLLGFEAAGAVAGQMAAVVLAALLALYIGYRILPDVRAPSERMYRPLLAFSLPLVLVQGMGFLNSNLDIYMVGYFMQSPDIGVYNIALQLGNLLTAVVATMGFLLPPVMTRLHEQGQTQEMQRTYQVITKWLVVLGLPVFVVLFFAPEFVIGTLFGGDYARGSTALRILLLGKLFAILMGLNGMALIALGENRVVSYIMFCQVLVNVGVNVLLIPVYGIEGAAVAIMASIIIGDVLGVAVLYRRYGVHPFTRPAISPVLAICALGGISYLGFDAAGIPTPAVVGLVGIAYLPIIAKLVPEPEDEELLQLVEERTGREFSRLRGAIRAVR